jgi:hypothetical protein
MGLGEERGWGEGKRRVQANFLFNAKRSTLIYLRLPCAAKHTPDVP